MEADGKSQECVFETSPKRRVLEWCHGRAMSDDTFADDAASAQRAFPK